MAGYFSEDHIYLPAHLRLAHGVNYHILPFSRSDDGSAYAPCGLAFRTDRDRIEHIVQHGKECVALNLLMQT